MNKTEYDANRPHKRRTQRDNAWARKRKHYKKMVRKFLSLNPAMNLKETEPLRFLDATYINGSDNGNNGTYSINTVTHIFKSPRGFLKVFRGDINAQNNGRFIELVRKDHEARKMINRRIRHSKVTEDEGQQRYSEMKKRYEGWR